MGQSRELTIEFPRMRYHQGLLIKKMKRWNVWVCHRRFGKTVVSGTLLSASAIACPLPSPRFAYIAPQYKQAKELAWDYLKSMFAKVPGAKANEAELRIDLEQNHARIRLYGADDPESLRGRYLDGVVFDEYAQMRPDLFRTVIRPALTDRQGWGIFIGTPFGVRNHFYDLNEHALAHPDTWSTALWRASATGIVPQAELDDARAAMTEAEYLQEFECYWDAPRVGNIFGEEMMHVQGRGRLDLEDGPVPGYPVQTAWDPGFTTAVWFFQVLPDRLRFIDYQEWVGTGIEGVSKAIREKGYPYDWGQLHLSKAPYERHIGPWDVREPDYRTGATVYGIAQSAGIHFDVLPQGAVAHRIATAKKALASADFCKKATAGVNVLRSYRYKFDEASQSFSRTPLHDWSSHGADAFGYAAVGTMGDRPPEEVIIKPPPGSFTFWNNELRRHKRTGRPMRSFMVGG